MNHDFGFEMFATNSIVVLLFMIIYVSYCQRRIKDGQEVTVDRKYVVYLVKAPKSEKGYDYWLCGGAIVNSQFVVTSAACVNDVDFLYVIAGYNKYVPDGEIEKDQCTSTMKKKVIYTCSPKGYELKYGQLDYWSFVDIALVKIESPFDFEDTNYETLCSYKPTTIAINYDERYQEPGTDALVLGWGHTYSWRKPVDHANYNQNTLKYAPTLLLNKTTCMEHYEDYANMSSVINTYMICSLGKGNIDDTGNTILQSLPIQKGCTSEQEKLLGFEGVSCETKSVEGSYEDDETRRYNNGSNKTNNITSNEFNETRARRSGICQNDHGGPLVTWAGAREILIGIASVFKVSEEYECMGPYLYTSTVCTGLFLDCILNSEFPDVSGRRYLCDRPASERGYDTIERTISWKDHPAGPAENENIGRSGSEPKISAGLKYLTNNNQPPGLAENKMNAKNHGQSKYASNQQSERANYKFQNPAILSNAQEERFLLQDKYPKNILGKEIFPVKDPVSQIESHQKEINEKYGVDINPETVHYTHNERFKIQERNLEEQVYPVMDRYPVNERSPGNETNLAAVRNPALRYPTNQRYPANGRYSDNVEFPKHHQMVPAKVALRNQRPLRV